VRFSHPASHPTVLGGPVRAELRTKAQCVGDSKLEEFDAGSGPAARETRLILDNLLSGEALPQTVALLTEDSSGSLLGLASVRIDGNAQLRAKASTPWFVRRLSRNPYVNLVARDERYRNHVLCDGRTRLGAAILRAGLEIVEQESTTATLPTVWALVRRENDASKRVFAEFAFYAHDRSAENQQDVFVRRAGRPLPAPPLQGAYVSFSHEVDRERSAEPGRSLGG
jgi:hypothetical protein